MLTALLAASIVVAPLVTPAAERGSVGAVFANQTAFSARCLGFNTTAPATLAALAERSLTALGWGVTGALGPSFTQRSVLQALSTAGAAYIYSHGDHYWDAAEGERSSGFRADSGLCVDAARVVASEIAAARSGLPPATLVIISTCHNGERRSKVPAAFGIEKRKVGPGEAGPRSFYIGYVDIAWQGGILVFERAFWRAVRSGLSLGAAYDRALLSGFSPAMLTPNWWGSYDALATPPSALPRLAPGQRYV